MDAENVTSRHRSPDTARRSTTSAPSTPFRLTANAGTRRAAASMLDGPTATGGVHVSPRSADEATTTGPPARWRHAKYRRSRNGPSDPSTTSADSWSPGGGPHASVTNDAGES